MVKNLSKYFSIAVMTIVGLHDFVKVSASLKSFLLIMCIDAPESTTNSRSSSLRVDFHAPLNFNTFLASFHAASRAPCSCHSVSSVRFTWANMSERRILVAILASSASKFGIEMQRVDDEVLNSSSESTSTSLIHCIASIGNCEQVHTLVLNLFFKQAKVAGNLSKKV